MDKGSGKGSIIVVDDEPSIRDVVSKALRAAGYDVMTAENGREALEMTARQRFDLMFLDIRMPGLSGYDVLSLMAAGNPATPVVMLTGVADEDSEAEAIQREAFAYLKKPCKLSSITDIADRLLTNRADEEISNVASHEEGFSLELEAVLEENKHNTGSV
ncbi:MAG: response regulator, partial [Chloroflexota bacterium]|nr:response regulator [Chloroflexota bacterium]